MGLTFNIVTSICIVLAVGIAVDYSLHVAHNFMIQTGSRKERACAALEAIGGEVLCGAATSWLAIKGLVFTQTYTMQVSILDYTIVHANQACPGYINGSSEIKIAAISSTVHSGAQYVPRF